MTLSPGFTVVTPSPTDSTIPAPSCPSMIGNAPSGSLPDNVYASAKLMSNENKIPPQLRPHRYGRHQCNIFLSGPRGPLGEQPRLPQLIGLFQLPMQLRPVLHERWSRRKRHATSELTLQVIVCGGEKRLVSEGDSVNIVGSLTFPTVSTGIMSTAPEILESLRERKEIQRFDWNQKILQKTAVFLSSGLPRLGPESGGEGAGRRHLANVLSPKNCLIREPANLSFALLHQQ